MLATATLLAIGLATWLPASRVARKTVSDVDDPSVTVELMTPYARTPRSAQPVANRVSFGELEGLAALDEDRQGDVFFVTRDALVPGGLLVVGTFAEDGPEQCSGLPVVRYDADGLVAELGPGFTLVESRRAEHHTPWDAVQPFTWVVLRRG